MRKILMLFICALILTCFQFLENEEVFANKPTYDITELTVGTTFPNDFIVTKYELTDFWVSLEIAKMTDASTEFYLESSLMHGTKLKSDVLDLLNESVSLTVTNVDKNVYPLDLSSAITTLANYEFIKKWNYVKDEEIELLSSYYGSENNMKSKPLVGTVECISIASDRLTTTETVIELSPYMYPKPIVAPDVNSANNSIITKEDLKKFEKVPVALQDENDELLTNHWGIYKIDTNTKIDISNLYGYVVLKVDNVKDNIYRLPEIPYYAEENVYTYKAFEEKEGNPYFNDFSTVNDSISAMQCVEENEDFLRMSFRETYMEYYNNNGEGYDDLTLKQFVDFLEEYNYSEYAKASVDGGYLYQYLDVYKLEEFDTGSYIKFKTPGLYRFYHMYNSSSEANSDWAFEELSLNLLVGDPLYKEGAVENIKAGLAKIAEEDLDVDDKKEDSSSEDSDSADSFFTKNKKNAILILIIVIIAFNSKKFKK